MTRDGEAMFELIVETLGTFFALRLAGRKLGAVTEWGGGSWGFLRMLVLGGPQTVPDLARKRGVTRQRMQKLADELAADGLVGFVANPRHKRSKLVKVTARGERHFRRQSAGIEAMAERLARGRKAADLRAAGRTLADLRAQLETIAGPESVIDN